MGVVGVMSLVVWGDLNNEWPFASKITQLVTVYTATATISMGL